MGSFLPVLTVFTIYTLSTSNKCGFSPLNTLKDTKINLLFAYSHHKEVFPMPGLSNYLALEGLVWTIVFSEGILVN